MSLAFYQKVEDLIAAGLPFVTVTVVDTTGSVPQDAGAKMIVDGGGRLFGTVGGGKVENQAIKEGQALLAEFASAKANAGNRTRFCDWNLQKDVGMTCGGSVRLFFEVQNMTGWSIVIFGSGHCSLALVALLSRLDCAVTCVDHRSEWLDKMVTSPRVKKMLVGQYLDYVDQIPPNSSVLLMTMGHSSDKPILLAILKLYSQGLKPFPYLGVIGSKAKAHKLHQDVVEAGLEDKYPFYCPIGLAIGSNDPQEIAISIAAQLIEERDKYYAQEIG